MEHGDLLDDFRYLPVPTALVEPTGNDAAQAVQAAPCDERPCRSMPRPRNQHRDDHVEPTAQFSATTAAHGDIDVVAEPCGQADMPPPPEVADIDGYIRIVEIQHATEAHTARDAARHVAVSGKIEIDLPRVRVCRQQPHRSAV